MEYFGPEAVVIEVSEEQLGEGSEGDLADVVGQVYGRGRCQDALAGGTVALVVVHQDDKHRAHGPTEPHQNGAHQRHSDEHLHRNIAALLCILVIHGKVATLHLFPLFECG